MSHVGILFLKILRLLLRVSASCKTMIEQAHKYEQCWEEQKNERK